MANAPEKTDKKRVEGGATGDKKGEAPGLLDRLVERGFAVTASVGKSAWRRLCDDIPRLRVPLTWFLVGLAITAENYFNRRSGAGPVFALRGTSLDLGIIAIFIGALLMLAERRPSGERAPATSLVFRLGLGILVASSVAHSAFAVDGRFGFGALASMSIFDAGIWLGAAVALLTAHRGLTARDLPGERLIAIAATGVFVVAALATFIESQEARSAFSLASSVPIAEANDASLVTLALTGAHPGAAAPIIERALGGATIPLAKAISAPPVHTGFSVATLLTLLAIVGIAYHAWRTHRTNTPVPNTACGCADVVIVFGLALAYYTTTLTTFGLLDPWEGHYGEVAREMLVRGDWISQFWEAEWFWSKPVGTFWIEALSYSLFGVSDFALRFPHALLGVVGITVVYLFCRELLNRRTAVIAAIALATMPHWFFVSRQGLTDMPFVALITAALGFFGLAMFRHKEGERENPRLTWVVFPLLFLTTLPQYSLVAEELEVYGGYHALAYLVVFVPLAIFVTTRRDPRSAYLYAFYLCCGLATLAKGLLGIALPGAILFAYLLITFEWRIVLEARIPTGIVIVALATLPWHIAMWARHGMDWWREYFEQHHLNRMAAGVHQTDPGTSFDYFIKWGAYGAFPWIAFLPLAASRFFKSLAPDNPERRAKILVGAWIAVTFTLFTVSATKFHHYIVPAMPALAIAVGYGLSEFWGDKNASRLPFLAAACIIGFVGYDFLRDPNHFVNLFIYKYHRPWPWAITPERTVTMLLVLGIGILALGFFPDRPNIRPKVVLGALGAALGAFLGGSVAKGIWPESTFRVLIVAAVCAGVLVWVGMRLAMTVGRTRWVLGALAALLVGFVGAHTMLNRAVYNSAIPLQTLSLEVPDDARANQTAVQYAQAFDHSVPTPAGPLIRRFVGDLQSYSSQIAKTGCAEQGGRPTRQDLVDLCNQLKYANGVKLLDFAPGLVVFVGVALILGLALIPGSQRRAIAGFIVFALIWAGWGMYDYMVQIAPHWTQREFFSSIDDLRADRRELPAPLLVAAVSGGIGSPFGVALAAPFASTQLVPEVLDEDSLAAFQMNWRTENWYSRNAVDPIHKAGAEQRLHRFGKLPGRRFVLIEKETISRDRLKQELARGGVNRPMLEWQQTSNKYELWSLE